MVQTLEALRSGGGSIKVGTTGTIGSLMTMEMESVRPKNQMPVSSGSKLRAVPVSVPCKASTPKMLQPRKSLDEASSSGNSNSTNRKSLELTRKVKSFNGKSHRVPMLGSDNIALERTPIREKNGKRGSNIVEIVDIKCGKTDRAWASPITNRLKKLGFSKLSESII